MRSRPGLVLAVAAGLLVGLAVLTEVLASSPSTADEDPGSPAGVVRAYFEALLDEDHEAAADLLAEDGECGAGDVERAYRPDVDRVLLLDTGVTGDRARVEIELVVRDGPFSAFSYTERHTVELVDTGVGWRIAGRPWPLFECWTGG